MTTELPDPSASPFSPLPAPRAPMPPPARRGRWRWRVALLATAVAAGFAGVPAFEQLRRSRCNENESAAIATLKNISSAQAQLQACGVQDVDGNGAGEYGFFAELAGVAPLRAAPGAPPVRIAPAVLAPRFGQVHDGCVTTGGYRFRMFLRDRSGAWVGEAPDGGASGLAIDAGSAEVEWLCYAWPEEPGSSGRRAFLIGQGGDVLASGLPYEGHGGAAVPPAGRAGFVRVDEAWRLAANTTDACGDFWTVI